MGLMEYHLRDLFKSRDTKRRKSPAAQQTAVMTGQYGNSALHDREDDGSADNEQLSEETAPDSRQSKESGFFGWVGGLFAEDIIFWFHGTQIKGKDKQRVKGGMVQLFSGVALDLAQASMTGTAEGERQTVRPLEGGAPAILVVCPAGRGFIKEQAVTNFVITAPKNGNADGFSAEIRGPITYDLGGGVLLHAEGAAICEELIVLDRPSLTGVMGDGEIAGAMINEDGIRITPKESPTKSQEEKAAAAGSDTEAGEQEQRHTEENAIAAEAASGSGTPEVAEAAPVEESHEAGSQPEVQKENEEEKKGEEKEEEKEEKKEEKEDKRKYIDFKNKEASFAEEDKSIKANLDTGEVSGKTGDVEANANLYNKTFKFSWGKTWPPEDEEEDDESESEEKSAKSHGGEKPISPLALKEALEKYYKEVEENSKEAAGKLGFAENALIAFFRTGDLPENAYEKKDDTEKDEGGSVDLKARVDILPGLAFVASLEPSWNFGFHFDLELAKAAEKVPKVQLKVEDGKVKEINAPDIERVLSLTAEVMGKIGLTLRLALQAGVGYLFYLEGGLSATGEARGTLEGGSDNLFGRGKIDLPVIMSGTSKKVTTGDAKMNLEAGIGLFGSVGGDVKVASEIFDWEKELYSVTFKEWNPANFKGAMELKQDRGKGSILNPASWEKVNSKFSVDCFKSHIEEQKKYGLVMTDASAINMKIDEGKALGEKLTGIRDKLAKIQEQISGGPAGGQFASENSEAYNNLMKELEAINLHLSDLILVGNNRLAEMKAAALEYQQDKRYKSNKAKAEAGKKKHEDRHKHMEEWGKAYEGQEAVRDMEAYSHYAKEFDAKGAERQRKEAQLNTAKNSLADKDSLIKYEEGRAEELGSKHNDRIKKLDVLLKKVPEDQRNVPNAEFVRQYREMGATALLDKAGQHVAKAVLIKHETERLEEYRITHKNRTEKLLAKLGESGLNITEGNRKKPNRAFAEYYYNELGGKRLFSEDELIHNHQNGKEIVEYELSRLKDRAGENMDHIEELKKFKARYEKEDATEAEKKAVMAEAQRYYKNAGVGRLGHLGQRKMDIASSASKQDILDYENRRRNEYQEGSGKDQKTYDVEKEALDKLQSITVKEKNGGGNLLSNMDEKRLKQVWKVYKDWLKSQDDDTVKDMVPLRMIMEYEEEQKKIIWNKPTKRKKSKEEIAQDRKYKQHDEAFQMLNNKFLELRNEQNEELAENETKTTKDAYFNNSADFLKNVKKGDIQDNELLKEVLEQKMESYGHVHADRLKKLREFMGLEEDSNDAGKSSKSDAQVWEYYKSIGAGKAFADDYAKQKKGKFSINDMLRYEQHEARENSKTNFIKAAVSRKVEATIAEYTTSEGGEELEEKRKQEKEGGHYDRYEALNAMLEKGESDQKIVEYYLSIGAGGGYVDSLRKGDHFLDVVTPDEILHYEQTRNGKDGEAHARRLKMLESLGDDMTNEAVYARYREEVLKDHSIKQFFEKVGIRQNIGFDGTIEPEDVLTPQMIYDYETKRAAQLTEKHTTRIEQLKAADEENAYAVYKENGGERGFMRAHKEQLKEKVSEIGDTHSYQNILDYDKKRSEFYQKILEEINEPLKRIEDAQKNLEKQITEARESQQAIQKYLDPSGEKAAFSSPSAFDQFAEETSGTNAQNIMNNGQEKIEEQVKAAEQAQAEAAQIMDEKMKLLEENPGA